MVRICGVIRESIVDGPGIRFVLFTQGCEHHCPGCHNPQSHSLEGGYPCSVDKIFAEFQKNPLLQGITLSGGDPILQAEELVELVKKVKEAGKNVVVYTGYTYEELLDMQSRRPAIGQLLDNTDLLIDGRFEIQKRDLTLRFRGSSNQRVIDMAKTRQSGQVVLADV